jgi:glycogen operon protein
MLLHGDELGRTQQGNNNVYCQDNELSWVGWKEIDDDLLAFTRSLLRLRAEHPVFRRRRFFTGETAPNGLPDIAWLRQDATMMDADDWKHNFLRPLAVFLNGGAITEPGPRGEEISDDSFLLLFNPSHEDAAMTLPDGPYGGSWQLVLDTSGPVADVGAAAAPIDKQRDVSARSVVVMRRG